MTRINCVPVKELSREHLLGENFEITRLYTYVRKAINRGETPDNPLNGDVYTFGEGHVRFFYKRLGYITKRYMQINKEMVSRGYKSSPKPLKELYEGIGPEWFGKWCPNKEDKELNRRRLRGEI